jgi:arsenate reductase
MNLTITSEQSDWRAEAEALALLGARHILFLCVANSARSQLAEGIARRMAPQGVTISSAGSEPSFVRPQAVLVMSEIGIDNSHHVSIGIDEVERPVDAVITLCAEEVCPVWLEDAWRAHWGLPDPAGAGSTEEEELDAFRAVRDELQLRLGVVFGS